MKLKKLVLSLLSLSMMMIMTGCSKKYELMSHYITGPFDTITTYMSYVSSEDEFNEQCDYIEEQLNYYDQLFDKYNTYNGMNNLKTINDNAGKKAIEVDQPLIDLLNLSIERNRKISSKVNIAFGSVINIWHDYREEAESHDGVGTVPSDEELENANQHTSIDSIEIDEKKKTVYINDALASIDVGATAKGYAIELIKDGLIEMGVDNFLLSGGGNVASHGQRKIQKEGEFYLDDCADKFCVGIESPQDGNYAASADDPDSENEAVLVVQGESIVTSGDYQRFYQDVNGVRYHHLIDPETLYPAVHFRSVSIITEDSGLADFLSSAVFLMEYEEGLKLVNSLDGVEAIWLLEDGKIKMSDGLKDNDNVYIIEKSRLK
ncbi:FAD:protein FMN transferase [Massilimicrobiota timonensis]|uniref:FAD:protein FMN transferase n=1 Tax=Massilimicrobiota timonensis TaxID=1776392 RepID=UPI001960304D|nr:FAD:protein FMN transferase [Massilimicrobiota timonensis]MBM6966194.1 FAD:protein FMN transferase [Massilimicrobiota timonensis]